MCLSKKVKIQLLHRSSAYQQNDLRRNVVLTVTRMTGSQPEVNMILLQKRAVQVCIITFSKFDEHTDSLFKNLGWLKLPDLVFLCNVLFMHDFYNDKLPVSFQNSFLPVSMKHSYNTRLASKNYCCIPLVRTNYGKFYHFQGPKIWNDLDKDIKTSSKSISKKIFFTNTINSYKLCI